jgi:hypothetical protein
MKQPKIGLIFTVWLILPGRQSNFYKLPTDRHHIAQNQTEIGKFLSQNRSESLAKSDGQPSKISRTWQKSEAPLFVYTGLKLEHLSKQIKMTDNNGTIIFQFSVHRKSVMSYALLQAPGGQNSNLYSSTVHFLTSETCIVF